MASTKGHCDKCLSGWVHKGEAKGTETVISSLPTYVATPKESNGRSILYITDIFGYRINNSRLLADQYAEKGYTVYVPDLLNDDPVSAEALMGLEPLKEYSEKIGKEEQEKKQKAAGAEFGAWLERHPDSDIEAKLTKFIAEIGPKGPIFAIGFCWGGKQSFLLGGKEGSLIKATAALHPAMITPEQAKAIKVPVALGYGTLDSIFSKASGDEIAEVIRSSNPLNEVKIFEGQVHGFAIRGDLSDEDTKNGYEAARDFIISFFDKVASQ